MNIQKLRKMLIFLFSKIDDLQNVSWDNNAELFKVCNAIRTAHRLGYATKNQLEYINKAKTKMGIE